MTSLCLVCCVSPGHTPQTILLCLCSQTCSSSSLCHFFFPMRVNSCRGVLQEAEHRAGIGRVSCSTGTEQPGWGSCYTPVQEGPSAKCPPEPCFSKWAKELKRASHPWQLKSITACLQDSGSEGRLGKWPRSLSCLPMFHFGGKGFLV